MGWTHKADRMPENHAEFEDWTKEVLVTDGNKWGCGNYNYRSKHWTYTFIGHIETDSNDITHWMYVPELPKEIEYDVLKIAIAQTRELSQKTIEVENCRGCPFMLKDEAGFFSGCSIDYLNACGDIYFKSKKKVHDECPLKTNTYKVKLK